MSTSLFSSLLSPFHLRFGKELWALPSFPKASNPPGLAAANVVVIGAGTTGAFVAHDLSLRGLSVIVVDGGIPGSGSTRACTALIQHELDTPLHELAEEIGETSADFVGKSCLDAVQKIRQVSMSLSGSIACHSRPTLYLASTSKDVPELKAEYDFRLKFGFPIKWISRDQLRERYPFRREAALFNEEGVELDPVALTQALLIKATDSGCKVFSPANVVDLRENRQDIEVILDESRKIIAKRVVVAVGYQARRWIKKPLGRLSSTYAAATAPGVFVDKWSDASLVWETARPYLYMRRTEDGRIIIGGLDKPFRNTFLRDILLPVQRLVLESKVRELVDIPKLKLERAWCGTFAESKDGMPFMGPRDSSSKVFHIFASGGNGVTFAALAPLVVKNWMDGVEARLNRLFALERKQKS